MSALGPRTWLLPLVGGVLTLPIAIFVVGPVLGNAIKGWPEWLAAIVFGSATLVVASVLCVIAIRLRRAWGSRQDDER